MQVFCKFFSKTVRKQTKTRHNTCEACAGLYIAMSGFALGNLRRGFSVHMGRIGFVSIHYLYKHKAKAPQRYKNVSLGSLAHA